MDRLTTSSFAHGLLGRKKVQTELDMGAVLSRASASDSPGIDFGPCGAARRGSPVRGEFDVSGGGRGAIGGLTQHRRVVRTSPLSTFVTSLTYQASNCILEAVKRGQNQLMLAALSQSQTPIRCRPWRPSVVPRTKTELSFFNPRRHDQNLHCR